jgi:hypothetical protein
MCSSSVGPLGALGQDAGGLGGVLYLKPLILEISGTVIKQYRWNYDVV